MLDDPTETLLQQLLTAHDQLAERAEAEAPAANRVPKWRPGWFSTRDRVGKQSVLLGRGRLVFAGTVACVAVAVATLVGFEASVSAPSALAAQMQQLATIAASQNWTGLPGKGQYLYTESYESTDVPTTVNQKECDIQVLVHRQIWRATDGSGVLKENATDGHFISTADKDTCASMGITNPANADGGGSSTFPAGKHGFPFIASDWRTYSTNPEVLLRQIHQHDGGPNTPAELLVNVADYLREADTPAAIRAALYRATALIPGVQLLGLRTDPRGQAGLAVAIKPHGQPEYVVIFDRHDARLLAEEYVTDHRLISWYAYTKQAIVDTATSVTQR